MHVLIIEDVVAIRALIREILTEAGRYVIVADADPQGVLFTKKRSRM